MTIIAIYLIVGAVVTIIANLAGLKALGWDSYKKYYPSIWKLSEECLMLTLLWPLGVYGMMIVYFTAFMEAKKGEL